MPRRNFFRGPNSEKKSSRKQHKYDDKIYQQQQQQHLKNQKEQRFRQQQVIQRQSGHNDRLQTSSSTQGSDPPLNLNGPTRTAPKHLSIGGEHYTTHSQNPAENLTRGQESYDVHPHHYQQPYDNQHIQQDEVEMHLHEFLQLEQEQLQHQQHAVHHSPIQKHQFHPSAHNVEQNYLVDSPVPTVENATDEMWRCGTGDFRSGSMAIQLLRLAVVTDWEQRQQQTVDFSNEHLNSFSYDPSETFLSLQGAALRFHANFESMKAERDAKMNDGYARNIADGPDSLEYSLEWELTEQAAWEVWEESLRATAALAHASVGPGWRHQLDLRKQLNHEGEMRALYGSSLQRNRVLFDNFSDGGSSIGGNSFSSYSFDVSNPQSSWRPITPGHEFEMPEIMPDIVETFRVIIPEVLPAAMIRFAASAIDCTPSLRTAQSKIVWTEEQSQQQMQSIVLQQINDERRWIRRLKRLGDTQRDLAFALFCVGAGASEDEQNDSENQQAASKQWSIPRVHSVMASLINSWLSSCSVGWPVPRLLNEVPCQFEEVCIEPVASDKPLTETGDVDMPPSEIIITDHANVSNSLDVVQSPEVEGDQICPLLVKFSYWNDIVDVSRKDWWYTLRVLRDCSDLISSGWCCPPSGLGNNIVFLLVDIAIDGLSPLGVAQHPEMTEEQICRENLVACSCAAESLAALKNLAGRDVIPLDSLEFLATSLCQLLSDSEMTINATNDESVKSSDTMLEKETFTQATFVASNSAELLWILLSTASTCCSTCDALLNLIDDRLLQGNAANASLTATAAVRALSAALWGDPPSVKGVPLLRYFWQMVVEVFGKVLNTHATIGTENSIGFSVEIILALRRLIDSELVYGNGDLVPTEWEALIRAIDQGILPLLANKSSATRDTDLLDEIYALFTQIQRFLIKVPEEYGLHPIVDYEARNEFHIHILRKCVPLLKAEEATALGLAAIKSWACIGSLPCRESGWLTQATSFLSEAFAQYDEVRDNSFPGGYVHSPFVRLEALKSLLTDQGSNQLHLTDSGSVATSISGVTSGTGISGALPILSLFTLTRNLRDLHLELINKLLLPQIVAILAPEYNSGDIRTVTTTFVLVNPNTSEEVRPHRNIWECAEAEFLLRKFATRVLGILFLSRSGEMQQRQHLIGLLKHVAVSKPQYWSTPNHFADGFTAPLDERLRIEIFRLRLEAIRQLELCLQAPFRELPHTHGNLPGILNALCETVTYYTSQEKDGQSDYNTSALLCLAAIIPLSRLSCGRNGQGIFLMRERVTSSIPACVTSIISDDGWVECCGPMLALHQSLPVVFEEECLGTDDTDNIAPFVFVRQCKAAAKDAGGQSSQKKREESINKRVRRQTSNGGERSDKTTIEIEPVATVIKLVLRSYCISAIPKNESPGQDLSSIIRIVCLHTISSFLSHGISFPNSQEDDWIDVDSGSVEELVSKSEAVSLLASIIGNNMQSSKIHVEEIFVVKTCDVLTGLASHTHPTVVKNACSGIVTLLTSMSKLGREVNKTGQLSLKDLADGIECTLFTLINHMCTLLECHDNSPDFILIPLMNATRASILCTEFFVIKKQLRRRILLVCLKMNEQLPWHVRVLAFFLCSDIIDLMTPKEAELLLFLARSGVGNDSRGNQRHQPLLLNVLRSKILYNRLFGALNATSFSTRRSYVVHEELAMKMLAIENFPVDNENGLTAAWKCGDTLLTLRMGSRSSLYRGWIEILLRSASCTVRRLVKVDKDISAEDPDSLLPFWELLQPSEKAYHENDNDTQSKLPNSNLDKENDWSQACTYASNLIERFDQLIQNDAEANDPDTCKNDDLPETCSTFDSTNQSEVHVTATPVLKRRKLKRSTSDGDISRTSIDLHPKEATRNGNHVNSWIKKTFDDHLDGTGLLNDLERLGFGSILFHDKLTPCKISEKFTRAVKILDRTTPFQTHRVSLLYGGPLSQKGRSATSNNNVGDQFLLATQASPDFWVFAKELGDIVPVRHLKYFSGGLDTSESSSDGSFAIVWFNCKHTHFMVDSMVVFHTVTLMPNKITNRKRHVGNDIVHIVYGLETDTLDVDHEHLAISGHFGFVTIYVIPFVCIEMVKITIHLKSDLDKSICSALSHLVGSRVVSRKISADVVRNLAQEADLICLSMIEEKLGLVLNIEERALKMEDMNRHCSDK